MTTPETSDAELLRRATAGDETAFMRLYRRYGGRVHRYGCRMLRDRPQAEDVVQDCFLSLLERPAAYDPNQASLGTYLCGIARHLIWKRLRHSTPLVALEGDEDTALGAESDAHETLERREVADQVAAAVGALPPLQREAVVLFEYEGLSLAEIAVLSGVEPGTISARLHRARERLRRRLAHLLPTEARQLKEAHDVGR